MTSLEQKPLPEGTFSISQFAPPANKPAIIRYLGVRGGTGHRIGAAPLWRGTAPPSFVDFVEGELGETLFPFQKQWAVETFGDTAYRLFSPRERVFVSHHWEKGTGKTLVAAWSIAYMVRVLMAMSDPWATLGHPVGASIDLFAVGANVVQTRFILFEQIQKALNSIAEEIGLKRSTVTGYGFFFLHPSGNGWIDLYFPANDPVEIEGRNPLGYVLDHSLATLTDEQRKIGDVLYAEGGARFSRNNRGIGFNWY